MSLFVAFLVYSFPLLKWRTRSMARLGGFLYHDIMWKNQNLLQFNTRWLASLRTRYYFRLCFSFSCSGYDTTLIQKSHTLNCYSFLHKFLLKTIITNSLLVTVITQFTAKTTNSEKAIYFLSLMSCFAPGNGVHLHFSITFPYFFHGFHITSLGNIHPITFWKYTNHPIKVSLKISTCKHATFLKAFVKLL